MKNAFESAIFALLSLEDFILILSAFLIVALGGFLCLMLCVFKKEHGINRLWFLSFSLSIATLCAFYCRAKSIFPYHLLIICFSLFIFTFALLIRKKKDLRKTPTQEEKESQLKVIRSAESELNAQNPALQNFSFSVPPITPTPPLSPTPPASPQSPEINLDFAHVRRVIERLSYFPLTAFDRKQINELESLLILAERGEEPNAKQKLNEKLSSLLKIMAKYGA